MRATQAKFRNATGPWLPALFAIVLAGASTAAFAQVVNRESLPNPDPPSRARSARLQDSTPDYPQPVKAPKGAPNVLLILLDDVGFGMCSTFGGPVPTPHMDKLAKNGLKYTRFHTTALCSPTRGALLAGRNHHSIGTGVIIEMGTGYPGYTGIIPKSTAIGRRDAARQRLRHGHVRQVAQHARAGHQPGRAVRPLADRPGLRLLLRLQPGRDAPVLPDALPQHHARCRSRRRRSRATTSPRT